jgi:hypothetical protein
MSVDGRRASKRSEAAYSGVELRCVECGRPFVALRINALACSRRCAVRRWRACSMLAGTHGWVNHQFSRLPSAEAR